MHILGYNVKWILSIFFSILDGSNPFFMKSIFLPACLLLFFLVFICTISIDYLPSHPVKPIPTFTKKIRAKSDRPDLGVEQENLMIKNPILGRPTPEKLIEISANLKKGLYNKGIKRNTPKWQERGPNNVGGRTRAVLIDANDPSGNTVWAGSASGGLWKTINFLDPNPNWSPIDDFLPTMAISCIVQDPSKLNIMYFGTGEGWFNGDAVSGLGIWKSTDRGKNWKQLSSTNNQDFFFIQKIRVNSEGIIFASTRSAGLQRSIDEGLTWEKVLGSGIGGAFSDRAADIEIANNDDIYVSLGIFSTDGIYKSMDSGNTWKSLINSSTNNGLPSEGFERIELAIAPSDPSFIYALFQASESNECKGIFMSIDAGNSWKEMTVPKGFGHENFAGKQAWYNLTIAVDPVYPYTVYIGGIDLLRSIDGGEHWTQLSHWFGGGGFQFVHADQHEIVFFPNNNRYKGISANDGGIFKFDINPNTDLKFNQQYCIPKHENCCNDFIERVDLNTLLNFSQSGTSKDIDGYSDYTGYSTTLKVDQTYDLKIVTNVSWEDSKMGAWVDWNQNGKFDESENILSYSGMGPYSTQITVPNNAAHGKTKMRIRLQYSPSYQPNPCAIAYTMGETEDYTIIVDNCFEGNKCNDGSICTTDNILNANCKCTGKLVDINEDGLCDIINKPNYQAINKDFRVTQFYSCDYHPAENSNIFIGGTQDNGTQYFSNPGVNSTFPISGGDGGYCFIDKNNPNIQISSYTFNTYNITNDAWKNNFEFVAIGDSKGRFINPCDYDSKTKTLIGAYDKAYISRIRKVGTENIADTLTFSALDSSIVSVVKFDPNQENKVWLGTPKDFNKITGKYEAKLILLSNIDSDNPVIEKVVTIDDEFEGSAFLRSIDISTSKSNRMILNFSNYGVPKVWETRDVGATWRNVDGNLPDIPVRWILYNPIAEEAAIIATELGVWQTFNLNNSNPIWEPLIDGLANVKVNMLKYRPSDHTLFAATHGRGIFSMKYCTDQINVIEAICSGDSYDFFGQELFGSGIYEKVIFDSLSCFGSINYVLNLFVEEKETRFLDLKICSGDSIDFFGTILTESGIYQKEIEADNICGCSITNLNLNVNEPAILELGDTLFLNIDEEFAIVPNGNFVSYLWSNGNTNSSIIINAANLGAGHHEVTLIVTDQLGCPSEDTLIIIVTEPSATNDIANLQTLKIYPNPAAFDLNLEFQNPSGLADIRIYTVNGKQVFSERYYLKPNISLNVQELPAGIYLLQVAGERSKYNRKFVKM